MTTAQDPINVTEYNLKRKHVYHGKRSRGMYELDHMPSTKMEEQRKCFSDLSSLSLFKAGNVEAPVLEDVGERPVTPINETIRSAPKTVLTLCKHIRRRINPRPQWEHISLEDQRSLGAVILGEVNAVWPTFRRQVEDPFLTDRQNKELQRRITVHVVTVCEQLFLYYCGQVRVLNDRGIFSEAANLSRIRGQLALDADKYLNLLSVRRHIISDLKKTSGHDSMMLTKKKDPVTPVPPKSPSHLSFRSLFRSSRPKEHKRYEFKMGVELKDMKSKMPSIDMHQAICLLPTHKIHEDDEEEDESLLAGFADQISTYRTDVSEANLKSIYKKWSSEPTLDIPSLLLETKKEHEELESPIARSRLQSSPHIPLSAVKKYAPTARLISSAPRLLVKDFKDSFAPKSMDILDPKQDLVNLVAKQSKILASCSSDDDEKDIPPLIQAITRCEEQEEKAKKLKQQEADLDERKRLFEEKNNEPLPEPIYPQPSTVQVKLPGQVNPLDHTSVTIRTSDIHIPDKVDLPTVALEMYGPLHNDLTGEISPATVKELDANLFQGEELKEVYDEIMKTVSNTHLQFDNDPMVIKPTAEVNLSKVLASSTLVRPRSQQIINPDFTKFGLCPPWGEEDPVAWERKDRPALTARESASTNSRYNAHISPEKPSRAYASWLAWWKATLTTDDYMKYLSTQETDFLGVIFHFYDSEGSESVADSESKLAKLEEERKRNELLDEIKAKKEHFVRGVWNANSVFLGGLGKYPDLDEYLAAHKAAEDEKLGQGDLDDLPREHILLSPRAVTNSFSASDDSAYPEKGNIPAVARENTNRHFSAGSESSFQTESSPRRKSASPRRRHRPLPQILGSSSDSAEEQGTSSSSETPRSEVSGSMARAPTVYGAHKMAESVEFCKDSGQSSGALDTDAEDSEVGRVKKEVPLVFTQDEYSSGYVSKDDVAAFRKNIRITKHRKSITPRRASRQVAFMPGKVALTSTVYKAEWVSSTPVKKPINLLRGFYKSTSQAFSPTNRSKSQPDKSTVITSEAPKQSQPPLQSRLETVWKKLMLSGGQKLDAALKYSSDQYLPMLEASVNAWERVTDLILKREKTLHDLETFERNASDPTRFFEKGQRGSSSSRLHEAKVRSRLYQRLAGYEKIISGMLESIHREFNDIITFCGRPYQDKMSWDKIEMLYWLQQERRCQMLSDHGHPKQLRHFVRENNTTISAKPPTRAPAPVPINHLTLT